MKIKARRYKIIAAIVIPCIMSVFSHDTAKAMTKTTYGYSAVSLFDVKADFATKYQEKQERVRYRDIGEADWPLVDSVQLIYEKHYAEDPNSLSVPYCTYNAKGNFYAEVADRSHSRIVLVYDGMSENGKCYLFVAEEEKFDENGSKMDNTSLLEFYAVNLEESEVYEAHKTSWGGAESEEYKKATRE